MNSVVDWSHHAMKYILGDIEEQNMDATRKDIQGLYSRIAKKRKRTEDQDMDVDTI